MEAAVETVKVLDVTQPQACQYCVPIWLRDEQIKLAIARTKRRIGDELPPGTQYPLRQDPIAVVCYGPSLNETWEKIKDFKYRITCSGAHKFLVDRGIIPTWHIDVDPRKHKAQLIGTPHEDVKYLIASTCHPKVFDLLAGFEVILWHIFASEEEAMRVLPHGEWSLTGGSSAGLRAMSVARFLGFTDLHIFGMDGNFGKSGKHSAEHPNQPPNHSTCIYEGKEYQTNPSVLECARQTFTELDAMPDVKATFYGDGLVQEMAKKYVPKPRKKVFLAFNKPELISPEYREMNAKLHRDNPQYGVGGEKHAQTVIKLAESIMESTKKKFIGILDYGCGKGRLAQSLPFPIAEYDPSIPGKEQSPKPAELVVCTDVLEHIEQDRLKFVLDDLKRCVKEVGYFVIATGASGKTYSNGCLYRSSRLETEKGPLTIKEVVDSKFDGKILAFDKYKQKFIWSRVIGHWTKINRGYKRKPWVNVITSGSLVRRHLRCTEDHPCATLTDILSPDTTVYLSANKLVGKLIVRKPVDFGNCHENRLYNREQVAVLLGMMVGDSHIMKQGVTVTNHCLAQREYINLKRDLLGGKITEIVPNAACHSRFNSYRLSSPVNAQTKHLRTIFYPQGGREKEIGDIGNNFNVISLAFWYMDDGCLVRPKCNRHPNCKSHGRSPYALFCTDNFTYQDQLKLQRLLWAKFRIRANVSKFHETYFRLRLTVGQTRRLSKLVAPFVPKSMEYKLVDEFRGGAKHVFDRKLLDYSAAEVLQVRYMPHDQQHSSKLYDIEVETYHNFVANNSVVHNSNTHLIQQGEEWWRKQLSKHFEVGSVQTVEKKLHIIVGPKKESPASETSPKTEIIEVRKGDTNVKFYSPNKVTKWRAETLLNKEPVTIDWIESMKPGETFFDVGANVGGYSVWAGKRGLKVFAFEPEAENYALLVKNLNLNSIPPQAFCMALTDHEHAGMLQITQPVVGGSCTTFREETPTGQTQACFGMAIDTLIEKGLPSPDHIKIDVDGFEYKVVNGAEKVIQNGLKSLLVEVDTNSKPHLEMVERICEFGFEYDQKQVDAAMRKDGTFKGCAEYLFRKISELEKHLKTRIAAATVESSPSPHVYIENVFPEQLYAEMLLKLPKKWLPIEKSRKLRHYPQRFTAPQDAFWTDLSKKLTSGFLRKALCKKFDLESEGLKEETLLIRDKPGYKIGPHTDHSDKVISALFYLPKDESQLAAGTSMFESITGFTCVGGPHYDFKDFRKVITMPFKPNSLFAFMKTDRSFHGVEAWKGPGNRDVLLFDIRRPKQKSAR